jgi:hypothetical protein
MVSLRTLAIVITGAGLFAGLPLTDARACDDDRYPCPVRAEVLTQETADVPIEPAPSAQQQKKSAQPQKKAKQLAVPNEKAHVKREQEAPQATAKASKPAVQEKTIDSVLQRAPEADPAVVPSPRAEESAKVERPMTTAGTAWPVLPSTEGAGVGVPAATGGEPTRAADSAVQLVDSNEINELDRAAAATVSSESSWSTYLLLILGAALAAAAGIWFFAKMTPVYARRAAGPRMPMRSEL